MEYPTQLLCTFSTLVSYPKDVKSISETYVIAGRFIYVLQNCENEDEVFLTYNIERATDTRYHKTISVHRKKEFNVIYSINALNELVRLEHGEVNKSLSIDWSRYQNSLVTTNESGVKITPTKLIKIIEL